MKTENLVFLGQSGKIPVTATMVWKNNTFIVNIDHRFWVPAMQNTLVTDDGRTCHQRSIDDMVERFRHVLEYGELGELP